MADSKLGLALIVFAVASALLYLGQITEGSWTSVATAVIWAYICGQVGAVVASGWVVAKQAEAKRLEK